MSVAVFPGGVLMAGKWLVVTGGGHGIGEAIGRRGAAAGWSVAVWDVDLEAARQVADSLGTEAQASRVDVTDESAVQDALARLPAAPSAVVNNAGTVRFGPLLELDRADWERAIAVNLTGAFVVARAAARAMKDAGTGCIVNIASINGVAAAPYAGGYSASKAGLIMLTQQMALEWAPFGLRVNAVAPGLIDAGMSEPIYADPQVRELRTARVPLNRLGTAEDIAEAVLYVIGEGASYVTGQTLVVDGGITTATLGALARPASVDSVGV
jgi:NAD(P)-dependent dehydrogenase (short-subunit alcohol dehydrogenase family)